MSRRPLVSPGNGTRRAGSLPPDYYPPVPQVRVLNPFWVCCLCCPDMSSNFSTAVNNAFEAVLHVPAEFLGRIINFCFGTLLVYLGPGMVLIALGIVGLLTYTFFEIMLPMLAPEGVLSFKGIYHVSIMMVMLVNVLHNYALCVKMRHDGPNYERVVRELADATGFCYPETEDDLLICKQNYGEMMMVRSREKREEIRRKTEDEESDDAIPGTWHNRESTTLQRRNVGVQTKIVNNGAKPKESKLADAPAKKIPLWMLLGPEDWAFCPRSNRPKPPRSHFDGITKTLILNLDHYCPWTFNAVGYFNYRYFCNFLLHVSLGMVYGLTVVWTPFWNSWGELYDRQIEQSRAAGHDVTQHMIPFVPTPNERLTLIVSCVIIFLTFSGAGYLLGFHLNLILTAQTTIEHRGNSAQKKDAERLGKPWRNPYSLRWRQNWQLVYGSQHPLLAVLPSNREPEFLPLPIDGKLVRRGFVKTNKGHSDSESCTIV
eukprot:scaffold27962_cov52-Attheya_sp.AAC.8